MIVRFASVVVLMTLSGCQQAVAPRKAQNYEMAGRCGGIARPWFNARNAPSGNVLARNELAISQVGDLAWNGSTINTATFRDYVSKLLQMKPPPEVDLAVEEGAPCTVVEQVRQMLSGYCANSKCVELSGEESANYSERFVIYAPPQKP